MFEVTTNNSPKNVIFIYWISEPQADVFLEFLVEQTVNLLLFQLLKGFISS